MRFILTTAALLSFSSLAGAGILSIGDLTGKYKGVPGSLPASITIEIFADGHMTAVKKIITKKAVRCEGAARVAKRVVVASLSCDDGAELTVNLDMSNVTELDKFSAPLWTKADRSDLRTLNFKKLD